MWIVCNINGDNTKFTTLDKLSTFSVYNIKTKETRNIIAAKGDLKSAIISYLGEIPFGFEEHIAFRVSKEGYKLYSLLERDKQVKKSMSANEILYRISKYFDPVTPYYLDYVFERRKMEYLAAKITTKSEILLLEDLIFSQDNCIIVYDKSLKVLGNNDSDVTYIIKDRKAFDVLLTKVAVLRNVDT